jgi:hypothetical protein
MLLHRQRLLTSRPLPRCNNYLPLGRTRHISYLRAAYLTLITPLRVHIRLHFPLILTWRVAIDYRLPTTEVVAATICFSPEPKYILPICRPDLDRAQYERPSYLNLTATTLVKRCSTTINFPPILRPDLAPAQPVHSVNSIVSCRSADQTLIPSNRNASLLDLDRYRRSLQCCSAANVD